MGEFTQNLLKLTEFPFSYSLIGLLALIFGQGLNLEDLSFAKLGPLLILMGFVATILSTCDPVGAIQRRVIQRPPWRFSDHDFSDLMFQKIFGFALHDHFEAAYVFAIRYTPEVMKKRYKVDWDSNFAGGFKIGGFHLIDERDLNMIVFLLDQVKKATVVTKWITAEIDRITALAYFIIIISLFIVSILLYPIFLSKFAQPFEDIVTARLVILIFSILGLIAVAYMLRLRIIGLKKKSSIVFRYLTALGAVKINKDKFKNTLDEIERYLDENHWALADYWMDRIKDEYSELFVEEYKKS